MITLHEFKPWVFFALNAENWVTTIVGDSPVHLAEETTPGIHSRAGVCRPCVETELTATEKSANDGD